MAGSEDKSFWATLPGVISAIAGFLGAVAAVVAALATIGVVGGSGAPDRPDDGPPSLEKVPVASHWLATGGATRFSSLKPSNVPADTTIELRCAGPGCFAGVRRREVADGAPSVELADLVPRLRNGATLEIRLLREGAIGKVVVYSIDGSTAAEVSCLPPGALVPEPC